MKLPDDYFEREDVVELSRSLLGKVLCTRIDRRMTAAVITETEAYAGVTDRASHAFGGRRTRRTEPLFGPPGHAYVYLCYGIHHLFNVVSAGVGVPHAILVRAGRPIDGAETMLRRRRRPSVDPGLMGGPGTFGQALGITTALTGTSLRGDTIWLEDQGLSIPEKSIRVGPRVGVDYAGADADLPYRFIAGEICHA